MDNPWGPAGDCHSPIDYTINSEMVNVTGNPIIIAFVKGMSKSIDAT